MNTEPRVAIPSQAIAPLRHRLQRLRTEASEAKDANDRSRLAASVGELEALIRRLENPNNVTSRP